MRKQPPAIRPGHGAKFHGASPRGLDSVPRSATAAGRFGRMFRNLAPLQSTSEALLKLAGTMVEQPEEVEDAKASSNNQRMSAGFTYLGQFIDHDLTFDPVSDLQRENDPDALEDFRTPRFDLDNLYGRGPDDSPFLYLDGERFVIGQNQSSEDDLPRSPNGRALIGDPRNDENVIVSQLHLAFLKFHNAVVDALPAGPSRFADACQIVRWHYQWVLVHDFLPKVVGDGLVDKILIPEEYAVSAGSTLRQGLTWKASLRFFSFKVFPFMPVEFSVAAYRYGHSMIRKDYALNAATSGDDPVTKQPREIPIFAEQGPDLRGFRPRPANRQIEWFRFFKFAGKASDLQPARAIDTLLASGLAVLPPVVAQNPSSLPARNLLRGKALGLPSGQDVARAMGIPEELILGNAQNPLRVGAAYKLPNGKPDPTVPPLDSRLKKELEDTFGTATPLWYYILKEAEVFCHGQHLGPVAGRIVAEVMIGLLRADPASYLRLQPRWQPRRGEFGCQTDGRFFIQNLLQFAGVA